MFHCLVIKVVLLPALCDSLFRLSHPEDLVKNFFQKFFRYFFKSFSDISRMLCRCHFLSVSATRLLYHKFSRLSTVNLNFLKTNLFFSISEAIPCDSLFILPLSQGEVKNFLQKVSYFFLQLFLKTFLFFAQHFKLSFCSTDYVFMI